MPKSTIVIIGGAGFIGTQLAAELAARGYAIKMLTRRRERKKQVILLPNLQLVEADVHNETALRAELRGADTVISMAGILNESRAGDFDRVHHQLPRKIAAACADTGIKRLLHVSSLGASADAPSKYLRSKAAGENALVTASGDSVALTIFRPSVVFGPGDAFLNQFAKILAMVPVALPLACAKARLAPVYVQDVVKAIANSVTDKRTFGESYNLCGPQQYSLLELVRYVNALTDAQRAIVPLGHALSMLQAHVFQLLPGKLLTVDNVRSMQVDSTCSGDDLAKLGVKASGISAVVPQYLGVKGKQSNLGRFRAHASRD